LMINAEFGVSFPFGVLVMVSVFMLTSTKIVSHSVTFVKIRG